MFSKKWVLSTFIVFSLLVVFAQLILQSQFVSAKIKQQVESRLEEILQKKVSIGHVGISLLSSALIVKDVSIRSDSALLRASLVAKEIRIAFSPVSFFTESFLIRRITIDSPELFLNAQNSLEDSINVLPDLSGKGTPGSESKDEKPFSVIIRSIRLKSGSVNYKGNELAKAVSLLDINGEIRPNLAMNHFEVDLSGEGGHYVLEGLSGMISRLEAKISIQPEKLILKRVSLNASHGRLHTNGAVSLKGKDLFDLSLDLKLPLEAIGSSPFLGEPSSLFDEKEIAGDIHFVGQLRGAYPAFSIEGSAKLPKLQVDGEVVASTEAEIRYQEGAISIPSFSGRIFSGKFVGAAELNINSMFADSEGKQGRPLFVVALKVNDLPLYAAKGLVSEKGTQVEPALHSLFASGDLVISDMGLKSGQLQGSGQLSVAGQARVSASDLKTSPLIRLSRLFTKGSLKWRLDRERLVFSNGALSFTDTDIRFDGTWQDSEGLVLNTALKSTEIGTLAKAIPFPLSGRSRVDGVLRVSKDEGGKKEVSPRFEGTITLEDWAILSQPFEKLNAHVEVEGKQIRFKKGVLKGRSSGLKGRRGLPPSETVFEGALHLENLKSPYFNFQTRLKSGNAQEVFGFFDLQIPLYTVARGRLKVAGRPEDFSVKGTLSLSEGWLYGERFDRGSVDLTVTQEKVLIRDAILKRGESHLSGEGEITYKEHFALALSGHQLNLEKTDFLNAYFPSLEGDIDLSVDGQGQFNRPVIKFRARFAKLRYHGINMLKGSIEADWIESKVHFDAVFPERHLAIVGGVHLSPEHPFSFHSRFSSLEIDQFLKNYLSGPFKEVAFLATGELTGTGRFSQLDALSFSAQLSKLTADFGTYQLENKGPLDLRASKGVLVFDQAAFKGQNTALTLNGSLKLLKNWDLFIKGEADLALLSYFSKSISSGSGKAHLDLSITDAWSAPQIRGQLTLNSGKVRLTHFSQSIQIDSLTALFNEQQLILENMEGRIGGGRFQLLGKATMAGLSFSSFGLFLNLDHTRVILADNLPVTLSGELFFQRQGLRQILKGDLQVLRLVYDQEVNLKTLVGDLSKPSGNGLPSENDLLGKTALNIHFMGDQGLRIENNVAKVPLSVDLLLKGSFAHPVLIGRIDVPNGEVFFLKNTFRVLSASVDFLNSKKIDPTFNMEASTEVRNVVTDRNFKIDLGLSGTLSQVTLTFNSFPSLPEDDILALLAIGKTAEDLDQVKGGASIEASNIAVGEFLSESVNEISGVVGDPLEALTGTRLKVDPYISGADSRTTTGTRLTAEKRLLKDQLLVIYSTTLDPNEEDLIKMVYEISKNVSIIGNRDDRGQIGGDLRFRFEFR